MKLPTPSRTTIAGSVCGALLASSFVLGGGLSEIGAVPKARMTASERPPTAGFEPRTLDPTSTTTVAVSGQVTTTTTPEVVDSDDATVEQPAAEGGELDGLVVEGVGLIAGWEVVACEPTGDGANLQYRLHIADGRAVDRQRQDPAGSYAIGDDAEFGPLPSPIFWTVTAGEDGTFVCQFA